MRRGRAARDGAPRGGRSRRPAHRSRIGINLGDVIVDGEDIYGDGVNVAARLEAMAEPGGICISRKVRDEIRDKLPYTLVDLGEVQVKNIARPVHVFRVAIDGAVSDRPAKTKPSKTGSSSAEGPRIAVLPFQNLSRDPDQEYFSDGLTEDLITELSRFPDLRVLARNTTMQYKGEGVDIRIGPACDSLEAMCSGGEAAFDFIFIDCSDIF